SPALSRPPTETSGYTQEPAQYRLRRPKFSDCSLIQDHSPHFVFSMMRMGCTAAPPMSGRYPQRLPEVTASCGLEHTAASSNWIRGASSRIRRHPPSSSRNWSPERIATCPEITLFYRRIARACSSTTRHRVSPLHSDLNFVIASRDSTTTG